MRPRPRRPWPAIWALGSLLAASPLHADLAFIQVVQGQTASGRDGIFGKTWIEIQQQRMRLVSGYARRVRKFRKTEDPRRYIQLLQLPEKRRLLVFPEKESFAEAPLRGLAYGNRLEESLARAGTARRLAGSSISLAKQPGTRRLLGVDCERYRVEAKFALEVRDGAPAAVAASSRTAVLVQHVWLAPLEGPLSKPLLELLAFENAYREAAGGALSPLDYERYQAKEAAVRLGLPESELISLVESVRARLRELPGYPLASSVAWREVSRDAASLGELKPVPEPASEPPPKPAAAQNPEAFPYRRVSAAGGLRVQYPDLPRFRVYDWGSAERAINQIYALARGGGAPPPMRRPRRSGGRPPRSAPREPEFYPQFEKELRSVLELLVDDQKGMNEELRPADSAERGKGAPFYEIYAELHGLDASPALSRDDFIVPKDYRQIPFPGE